jgi:hypothetical protein
MTNARVAGSAFLLYIVLGLPAGMLMTRAISAEGIAAKLVGVAQHANDLRVAVVLVLFSSFCALVLGVTLYGITREVDPDLAMLALTFRVGEGVIGCISVQRSLGLLWVATAAGANAPDNQTAHALGTLFTGQGGALGLVGALFFAVGSTIFCWLLVRGRMIPAVLAWLGVVVSVTWVVGLPLQLVGVLHGPIVTLVMFVPMAAFEVPFALWLLIKGVAAGQPKSAVVMTSNSKRLSVSDI